jgi:hypothetical protein
MTMKICNRANGTISNHRSSRILAALLSLPLCMVSGCLAEPEDTGTATQALGPNCHVLRPYGWSSRVRACSEGSFGDTFIDLSPGERITFEAGGGPIFGIGSITVTCHTSGDGLWSESRKSCGDD